MTPSEAGHAAVPSACLSLGLPIGASGPFSCPWILPWYQGPGAREFPRSQRWGPDGARDVDVDAAERTAHVLQGANQGFDGDRLFGA